MAKNLIILNQYILKQKNNIEIICRIHGPFLQIARNHLQGQGCPICGGSKQSSTTEFIIKANKIHKNRYDYSLVEYVNNKTKINIICKIHYIFPQTPSKHLIGHGCPKCAKNELLNLEEFIKRANKKHNNKYDYSNAKYVNNNTKLKIICPIHGEFTKIPMKHLAGQGCAKCTHTISGVEVEWLNFNNLPDDAIHRQVLLKFNGKYFKRVDGFDPETNTVYEFYGDYFHGNPKIYKAGDENKTNHMLFGELYRRTLEKEKLIKDSGYKLITMWESDFKQIKARQIFRKSAALFLSSE